MNSPPLQPIWAIAVFAHNEEDNIVACLRSLFFATARPECLRIYVLNNGSSDATAQRVSAFAEQHAQAIELINLSVGDKANAWNYFVHELKPQADWFGFADGDVLIAPLALDELRAALQTDARAHLATAVPFSGRSRQQQIARLLQEGGVQGNLYATRAAFIESIRQQAIRMPLGFVREDGLVGAFAMFDLDPLRHNWDPQRVAVAPKAGFIFPSLQWWRWEDVHLYWRRRIRYSLGHFEFLLLRPLILQRGFAGIPRDVASLYASTGLPPLRWRGFNTLFDAIALRRIRRGVRKASAN